ncbi:MAG: hypothetical protein NDI61_06525 [Bdellovibrionaceae bacterium]|nr:hypothetical protein [Pseudobdellovibrionaceae bacterium]
MEPLTEEVIDKTDERAEVKSSKAPDRVTLGKIEVEKVDQWLSQINTSSKGFLALTKSDVVNFLIRNRKDELGPKELLQIRADHYDPIRHITWITPQIKAALSSGDIARVGELQEELRGVELSVIRNATTRRKEAEISEGAGPRTKRRTPRAAVRSGSELKSKPTPEAVPEAPEISGRPGEISDASNDV